MRKSKERKAHFKTVPSLNAKDSILCEQIIIIDYTGFKNYDTSCILKYSVFDKMTNFMLELLVCYLKNANLKRIAVKKWELNYLFRIESEINLNGVKLSAGSEDIKIDVKCNKYECMKEDVICSKTYQTSGLKQEKQDLLEYNSFKIESEDSKKPAVFNTDKLISVISFLTGSETVNAETEHTLLVHPPVSDEVEGVKPALNQSAILSVNDEVEAVKPVLFQPTILSANDEVEVVKPALSQSKVLSVNDEVEAVKLALRSILSASDEVEAVKLAFSQPSILSASDELEAVKPALSLSTILSANDEVEGVKRALSRSSILSAIDVKAVKLALSWPTITPAIDYGEVVKQTVSQLKLNVVKPNAGVTESTKGGAVVHKEDRTTDSERQDEIQLFEQMLQLNNFHVKESTYVVYMAPYLPQHPSEINGISWNLLNIELWRLHTYSSYPHSAQKSAILLAESGFAYYGSGSRDDHSVICYFCCATKQSWEASDVIVDVHKHLSPECSMVTGVNCTNVPMTTPLGGQTLFNKLYCINQTNPNDDNKPIARHNANLNEIQNDGTSESRAEVFRGVSLLTSSTESSQTSSQAPTVRPLAMENEVGITAGASLPPSRQETARHSSSQASTSQPVAAPSDSHVNVQHPSVIGNRTQTAVAHQGNRINSSTGSTTLISTATETAAPTPATNRQQTSSSSVANQASQNPPTTVAPNLSTVTTQSNTATITTATPQGGAQTGAAGKGPTYGELGIITERPKRFEYAVTATRLSTFDPWPRDHHLKKTDLADAGFYYAGYGDCARCFYCGGGLRNWEDDDNVYVEHARWFPKCAYIRQKMGQQFVDSVQDLNRSCDRISFQMVKDKIGNSAAFSHLDTMSMPLRRDPAVLTVLDLGYSEKDVLEAATFIKEKNGALSADTLFKKLNKDKKPKGASKQANPVVKSSRHGPDAAKNDEAMSKLKEENSQLRQQTVCKICMDKEVAVVFLPCGHFVSCTDCASAMKDCPVCRKQVRGIVRAFVG